MENKLIVSKRGRSFGRLLNLNFAGKNFSCKKYVRNLLSLLSGLFYFVGILKAYPSACLFSISSVMKAHIFVLFYLLVSQFASSAIVLCVTCRRSKSPMQPTTRN